LTNCHRYLSIDPDGGSIEVEHMTAIPEIKGSKPAAVSPIKDKMAGESNNQDGYQLTIMSYVVSCWYDDGSRHIT